MITNGKLLLIGEYTILEEGKGLAIPLEGKEMSWSIDPEPANAKLSNQYIKSYVSFLKGQSFASSFDIERLDADLEEGYFLQSNIPQGYGAGSSGAVCASILHKYGINNDELTIKKLRTLLIQMESYFHGQSSGIDPLVAYFNQGILIEGKKVSTVDLSSLATTKFSLVDTRTSRKTSKYVKIFRSKKLDADFQVAFNELKDANDQCITNLLAKKPKDITALVKKISQIQFDHFREMIPSNYHQDWQNGLDTNGYYYKLCGAGGGGYILKYSV